MISRITHHKDIVPHIPVNIRFMHTKGKKIIVIYIDFLFIKIIIFPIGEFYQEGSNIKECEGYEDPTCANQWKATNVEDHLIYLGLPVGCIKKE